MIKTIIGLFLIVIPFLLIVKFKDKKTGFLYVLTFLISFYLITAVLTQMFHLFTYKVMFAVNLILSIIIIFKTNFKELKEQLKKIKIDWILIFVLILLFVQLFSVHYNYTGKITTINEQYKEVKNMKYVYPYFSDEWYAVSLINYSIQEKSLPLKNPLDHQKINFINFELPFHSFISGVILTLGLNPLTQYTLLSALFGVIIGLIIYIFLTFNSINKLSAGIATLSIPYISNGANLPGLWNLLPITLGIISFLLSLSFMSLDDRKMIIFTGFLTLFFYPPFFLFYTISLIVYIFSNSLDKKNKNTLIFKYFILCLLITIILSIIAYLTSVSFSDFTSRVFSKLFYSNLTGEFIPQFLIFNIIPIPLILLSIFGLIKTIKDKKWFIIYPFLLGLLLWVVYSFTTKRFIIEYERVIFFTSILLIILSGFGIDYMIKYLNRNERIKKYKILSALQLLILIIFLFLSFSYTERENWMNLKAINYKTGETILPASPANNYLHQDDINLFKNLENRIFLSPPWKGVVIGVSTNSYPLSTKSGTITIGRTKYEEFMDANCEQKRIMGEKLYYVYSSPFDCYEFDLIGVSSEGLYLYKN